MAATGAQEVRTVLAGDIGGTKVNLALFRERGGTLSLVHETRFESRNYSGLEQILEEFAKTGLARPTHACFGIAGPVKDGKCQLTNLPWSVEVERLKDQLDIQQVWLINDLAAMACAIPFLQEDEVCVLQPGEEEEGRMVILAAGTGLGQAFLIPNGKGQFLVIDSEGGHSDFAPRHALETDLLHFFQKEFERVSVERVLSGSGLYTIYQFIREIRSYDEPDWLTRQFEEEDHPGVVITRNGLEGTSAACQESLDMFVSIYGAVAGNLALQVLASGGVYVGGGIAPRIISRMTGGRFMEEFLDKGRFQSFLETVPVKVILNEKAPLLGAAQYALGKLFVRE